MSLIHPEEHFRLGMAALKSGKNVRAASHFHDAISEVERLDPDRSEPRYTSYYGFSLALAHRPKREFISMCEQAARTAPTNPEIHANLGRVYLLAGHRSKALAALAKGLKLAPDDKRLRALLSKFDRRRPPVIPGLGRDHAFNVAAGKLRHRLSQSR